eukprot:16377422-Heterocapsa_arctica.AAC.1
MFGLTARSCVGHQPRGRDVVFLPGRHNGTDLRGPDLVLRAALIDESQGPVDVSIGAATSKTEIHARGRRP